jgi:hypothetical protein
MNIKEDVIKGIQMAISLYKAGNNNFHRSYNIYEASIGIILLQDSVEIFLSSLCEQLGINLKGNEPFHQYIEKIEEEVKEKLPLKKQINILNKQRINIKHFALLPNLQECQNYSNNVWLFLSEVSLRYLGKDIDTISLVDFIKDINIKKYLKEAEYSLNKCQYKECQINCRKALYFSFERKYDRRYREGESFLLDLLHSKEDYNKMLEKEIYSPIDFLKKDDLDIRNTLIEMGIEIITYKNLMNLTPEMYYYEESDKWVIKDDFVHIRRYDRDNSYYCLNKSTDILIKKQDYENKEKNFIEGSKSINIKGGNINLYRKTSINSNIDYILDDQSEYIISVDYKTKGLDNNKYYYVLARKENSNKYYYGYICEEELNEKYINVFNLPKDKDSKIKE